MLGSVTFHGWVESAIYNMIKNEEEHETTIEREFRSFPKPKNIEIKWVMGEPGDDAYEPELTDVNVKADDEILMLIRSSNGLTEKELQALTGLGRTSLKSKLATLERKGLIFCDKQKRPALWMAVVAEVKDE